MSVSNLASTDPSLEELEGILDDCWIVISKQHLTRYPTVPDSHAYVEFLEDNPETLFPTILMLGEDHESI